MGGSTTNATITSEVTPMRAVAMLNVVIIRHFMAHYAQFKP